MAKRSETVRVQRENEEPRRGHRRGSWIQDPTGSATEAAAAAAGARTAGAAISTAAAVSTTSATTATTAAAVTTTATTATTAIATGALLRLVDAQGATVAISAVERLDRGLGLGSVVHGHETEAAAAASLTVDHALGAGDGTIGFEELAKTIIIDGPGQVADIDFHGMLTVTLEASLGSWRRRIRRTGRRR